MTKFSKEGRVFGSEQTRPILRGRSPASQNVWYPTTRAVITGGDGGDNVLVSEYRGMALNGLFCADVLRPHDLVPPPH